ncbi:ankyrin repeat containing protein yar1 [Sporothrix brasiliensis 5110]|uniref:protein S-acyltransferase n=1 Tax=Sporothrix brasiliensis 5110 TaxID=1398154 RepID=A0A0C2ICZ9_9PEZI|nr:ankyrin repeat containing protein yar1 [Sporothrix brasiliensis 5110]KIH87131.1 ankyrin repeat containing protein yar1 [Sporothrix brasiliensis 5110]
MVTLTEDEVDDLLYFARANEAADLADTLAALVANAGGDATPLSILTSAVDAGKNTPLHMAAGNGHLDIVTLILSQIKEGQGQSPAPARQAFLDATNAFGNTALHWAAMNGHLAVVRALVEQAGASPALANDKNYVALDLAGLHDQVAVVDYFLASAEKAEKAEEDAAAAATVAPSSSKKDNGQGASLDRATAALDLNKEPNADDDDDDDEEEVVVMTAKREGDEIVFDAEKR